ncbi:LuxR family transcriptional regulator, partial [Klebsiella oxytoca]|nr:LuxR family transcriptional regulator [Klebsiella oxytoca]
VNIGKSLNLHIKTIYQIRLTLIKKLGCSGRTDFFNISRSETFKAWTQQNF